MRTAQSASQRSAELCFCVVGARRPGILSGRPDVAAARFDTCLVELHLLALEACSGNGSEGMDI